MEERVEHSVAYGGEQIRYVLRRQPERKSGRVAIHVEPDGRVLVDAPSSASARDIHAAVSARVRWIYTRVTAARARLAQVLPREYVSGESWMYLGRRYRLKVRVDTGSWAKVRLSGAYLTVTVSARAPALVRKALDAWYRARAKAVLTERLALVASTLRGGRVPSVRLQAMKVQWGSCSPAGRLTLNPHLVKAPRECIDYVLLHELCHLAEHNHSRRYYRLLDMHMPQWRQRKSRLDNLADTLLNC